MEDSYYWVKMDQKHNKRKLTSSLKRFELSLSVIKRNKIKDSSNEPPMSKGQKRQFTESENQPNDSLVQIMSHSRTVQTASYDGQSAVTETGAECLQINHLLWPWSWNVMTKEMKFQNAKSMSIETLNEATSKVQRHQRSPENPSKHLHLKLTLSSVSRHDPPFIHGKAMHSNDPVQFPKRKKNTKTTK